MMDSDFIALLSFLPSFCPDCGRDLIHTKSDREAFFAGATLECKCGVSYRVHPEHTTLAHAVPEIGAK